MIFKSFVLIEKEGRYLLIREASKKWKGKWFLPGGKVEANETPQEAAYREVREEAGCEICINGMFYFNYNKGLLDHYLAIFFTASAIGDEIKKYADRHSLETKWFTYEEIKTLPVRQNLLDIFKFYDKMRTLPLANFEIN